MDKKIYKLKELIVNFISFGLAIALESLFSFLLIPLYARTFSVEEFGAIDLIQTFIGIVSIFAYLQIETSLQRYYYDYEGGERRKFTFTLISLMIVIALILSCIVVAFSGFISEWLISNKTYHSSIIIVSIQLPFTVLSVLTLIVLRFEKKNKLFFISVLVKSLLLVTFVYVFLVKKETGVNGYFMAQLLAVGIASLFSLLFSLQFISFHFVWKDVKKALKYALPQFPARIGSAFNSYANRFFMVGFLSIYSIGIFSMAQKFGAIMMILYQVFMMAWNQYMFKIINNPNHKFVFKSILKIISPIVFFLAISVGLLTPEIINTFASETYISSAKYIGIIVVSICILITSEIINVGPKITSKTHYMSISFIISFIVNILSLFIFVRHFELPGVLFSMLLTNLVLIGINWYFSEKLYFIGFDLIYYFIVLAPALGLSIVTMYIDITFNIRVSLLFLFCMYYLSFFYFSIKKYKKVS